MKYDHAKPLIEELMHIAVLFHASGMLRTKIFDALKEFVPDMDDGCFERGCPAIDHFAAPVQASDEFKEMVEKGTKAWADTPDDWVDDLRGGIESCTKVGTKIGVLHKEWVGLTDEEVVDLACSVDSYKGLCQATEAKLKEKNCG